jgi:hypothetical protein
MKNTLKIIRLSTVLVGGLLTLTTLPEVGVGVGVGIGGGPYWGPGVGVGIGFGPSYPKGAVDKMGRDYWRIDNEAPFAITVQSDRKRKMMRPGKRMVKLHRFGDFNFMVMGGGIQQKLGSYDHNLAIGLDQTGNLQIIGSWNQ